MLRPPARFVAVSWVANFNTPFWMGCRDLDSTYFSPGSSMGFDALFRNNRLSISLVFRRRLRSPVLIVGLVLALQLSPFCMASAYSENPVYEADAFFEHGSAEMAALGKEKLRDLADKLEGARIEVILAVGFIHASETNADALSQRRAHAVKFELLQLGVPPSIIYAEGRGVNETEKIREIFALAFELQASCGSNAIFRIFRRPSSMSGEWVDSTHDRCGPRDIAFALGKSVCFLRNNDRFLCIAT
jgi:hypothetical protein